jgi:hypothetical protein
MAVEYPQAAGQHGHAQARALALPKARSHPTPDFADLPAARLARRARSHQPARLSVLA